MIDGGFEQRSNAQSVLAIRALLVSRLLGNRMLVLEAVGWCVLLHVGTTSAATPGIRSAATQRTQATFLSPGQLSQHVKGRTKWKLPPSKKVITF